VVLGRELVERLCLPITADDRVDLGTMSVAHATDRDGCGNDETSVISHAKVFACMCPQRFSASAS
jgi:hypothetical protein